MSNSLHLEHWHPDFQNTILNNEFYADKRAGTGFMEQNLQH